MGNDEIEAMMKRHAAGDRDPDLMGELTRRAWSEFHDPWEQAQHASSAVLSLRRPPIDADPYDPDRPEKLDVATLDLFVGVHCRSHLRRKSWPFFVTYDYLADPEPERCPRILMESPDGRNLTCGLVRFLQCKDADLPKVQAFCQHWSEGQDRVVAKLVEASGPGRHIIALSLGITLPEENPAITLRDFDRMLHDLLEAAEMFWNQVRTEFEP